MPVESSPATPASTIRRATTPPGGPSTFDLFSWSEGPDPSLHTPVRHSIRNDSAAFVAATDERCTSPPSRPALRLHHPVGGASSFAFGEQMTPEEAEALVKRKPASDCKKKEFLGNEIFRKTIVLDKEPESARPGSEVKRKEMFGSGIFVDVPESADQAEKTCVRLHQRVSRAKVKEMMGNEIFNAHAFQDVEPNRREETLRRQPAGGVSQIQFGGEEVTSPKKPTSIPEVAKQRELSGSTETTLDLKHRSFSNAKAKELSGSNIFGPAPADVPPRRVALEVREQQQDGLAEAPPRNLRTSVKVSNPAGGKSQIAFGQDEAHNSARKVDPHKIAELSGNNIFSDGPQTPLSDVHHQLSSMKLREMSGNDIFKDDKPVVKDSIGGIRKPPGGDSTIALV